MIVSRTPASTQKRCLSWRAAGETIALVPTMGALHEGHASLIRAARTRADRVVVSIFVNPAQFGPAEDFKEYPRTFAADRKLCTQCGADMIFAPAPDALYAPDHSTWVEETALSRFLCGARRPGHFRGVCTVVLKLFAVCQPHVALFGQKDAQQCLVIQRMVRDLNLPVRIAVCPIVRDEDGLALSSRNRYLSAEQRRSALALSRSLRDARRAHASGMPLGRIRRMIEREIAAAPGAKIDYVSIVDEETLAEITHSRKGQSILIALAVYFGNARLIDNIRLTGR